MRIHYILIAVVLSGCASFGKTPYAIPPLSIPDAWQTDSKKSSSIMPTECWWRNFHDTVLSSLIENVLHRNSDLAIAAITVRRARLQAGITNENLLSKFNASINTNAASNLRGESNSTHSQSISVGMVREIDLWGKTTLQREAAQWAAQAAERDFQGVVLSLISTTMRLYWQAGYLNERIAWGIQSTEHAKKTLAIARVKHVAGSIAFLDVLQAEQALFSRNADLEQLMYQREENKSALALLFGPSPNSSPPDIPKLPDDPDPIFDEGLPIRILSRRPDLQAAELRLRQVLASGDASRISFYPTLSLEGSVGSSSSVLLSLLRNPLAALGAGISLPFIQWDEMKLNAGVAQADYEQAVITFQQTFYHALGEVENVLLLRKQLIQQTKYLNQALATARKAERIAEIQYRAGNAPLKLWLDAQEDSRSALTAVAATRLEMLVSQGALYQALGGDTSLSLPSPVATDGGKLRNGIISCHAT